MLLPKTLPPYLFQYTSLREFLLDYVQLKKVENRNWNLSRWAKKLGLTNAATLTRILSGDRTSGEVLSEKLANYFEFSGREKEYFEWIGLKDRSSDNLALTRLIHSHIDLLRGQKPRLTIDTASSVPRELGNPLLLISSARILVLCGSCDEAAASSFLSPHGLELAPVLGGNLITLSVAQYDRTSVGPYSEAYIAFYVKAIQSGIESTGFYYAHLLVNNPQVATFGRMIWGNPFQLGTVGLQGTNRGEVLAHASDKNGDLISLIAKSLPGELEQDAEDNVFFGITGRQVKQTKYLLKTQGPKKSALFDPNLDSYSLREDSEPHKIFKQILFHPILWHYYEDVSAKVFAPEQLL